MIIDLKVILLFIFVFVISILFNILVIKFATKLGLVDMPNHRSMHTVPKPRGGGVAIWGAFFIGIFLVQEFLGYSFSMGLLATIAFMWIGGIYDDIFGVSSKVKLLLIFIASNLLLFNGFELRTLGIVFGNEIIISSIVGYIVLMIATSGFTNALNLIDGLDGLASTVGIIILGAFAWMGFKLNDPFLFFISSLAICSILGFLIFNWHPARIFMGDSGSLTIGFVIVVLSVYSIMIARMTPASLLLIAAVPILDTLVVMVRRIKKGLSPFSADKTHIHHLILRQQKRDIRRTVLLIGGIQLLFTYIGMGFKVRDDMIILTMFCLLFFVFYFLLTPRGYKI